MENDAKSRLESQIAKPVARNRDEHIYGGGDYFDPWELFPAVYGSYSSEFDDCAILVLENIVNKTSRAKEGLAHEMFREMLCVEGFADYGTSPRGCFPEYGLSELFPLLLEKWKAYRDIYWR